MKIVFMGTPSFSVPILEALIEKYEVALVVTQPDKLVGRKQVLTYSPVKECALKHNISVFQPEKIRNDYKRVLDIKPDIIITAAYGQMIPDCILECGHYKPLNVHGSLSPKYRGGAPIQRSIINGDEKTGITIMYMASKMDSGDILMQEELPILDSDTNTTVFEKLSYIGRDLLLKTLTDLENNNLSPIAQDESKVTYAWNIKHEEQYIDWNKSAKEVFNLVRGLAENPGALTVINDTMFKIGSSRVVDDSYDGCPGEVVNLSKKIIVKCKEGSIEILTLQASGKKMMDAKSFINGQKIFAVGDKFN